MSEELKTTNGNRTDPTVNVRELINLEVERIDDLRDREVKRIDERIDSNNEKYQIQFNDSKEAVLAALTATKEAIGKAEQANEKRFDAVNEFRSTLGDQQAKLITRTEYESNHSALAEKIDGITDRINRTEGASNVYVTQQNLNDALAKLQANIEITLRPVITFMNNSQGQQKGISSSWGALLGIVGLISTIIGIFLVLSRFLP